MTHPPTRRRLARTAAVLAATAVAAVAAVAAPPAAEARPPKGDTARVSEGFKGEQPNGYSSALGLSEDGRAALFTSTATNLLPGPGTPNSDEVYVRDLRNGHLERISVADDGSRLDAPTTDAAISGDGRFVAFSTAATNVLPGQPKHAGDVFVRDRWTGRTELVSAGTLPSTDDQSIRDATSPSLSRDGRYVAYVSNRTDLAPGVEHGRFNVYVTDRWTRTTRLVTVGANGEEAGNNSYRPTISADGSTIGFTSRAGNLLPPDPAGAADQGADDTDGPALTGPRYYPYYVWTADTGRITVGSVDGTGARRGVGLAARISPDGRHAVYTLPVFGAGIPTSNHGIRLDVYVHELATGRLTKVNTDLPGTTTKRSSGSAVMTADSRWVYFESYAETLVAGDTNDSSDIFRRDLWTGRIERVSLTRAGGQGTADARTPYVDATGGTVLFDAEDGDLVPGDTNAATDVFRRRL
ncbi:TolB family protein [Kitasatospora sp. NPDC001547]|uniref:TolB family protein n=1 Tax=Kitasatospora sp. NPDC001547 TaxID=3364015 RepID=UPI0036746D06